MKKSEFIDKYWYEYLEWCAKTPEGGSEFFKWLKLKEPNEEHFWLWTIEVKKMEFKK